MMHQSVFFGLLLVVIPQWSMGQNGEPIVTSVHPLVGPYAGGTEVVFTGQNFPPDIQNITFGDNITMITLELIDSSSTTIRALTPEVNASYIDQPLPIAIVIDDNTTLVTSFLFTYKTNPTVTFIYPLITRPSGRVKLTVGGTGFDSVGAPKMTFTVVISSETGQQQNYYEVDCDVQDANTMYCETPEIDISEIIASCEMNDDPANCTAARFDDITVHTGFILDGVLDYRNISAIPDLQEYGIITVVPNPEFEKNQHFQYTGDAIQIKGGYLKTCCNISEYKVFIGPGNASVLSVEEDVLLCQPINVPGVTVVDLAQIIEVHVGSNLQFVVGTLTFVQEDGLLVWLIPVVVVIVVLVVAIVVTVVVLTKRRKENAKEEDSESRVSDSDSSDTGSYTESESSAEAVTSDR